MPVLSAEKITIRYSEKPLLNEVSLFIDEKEKIGVIGLNGAGKSTLLKIIAGIETPDFGVVTSASGVRISYLGQNPEFDSGNTVIEQVVCSAAEKELQIYEAKAILNKLGITEYDKQVRLLSGGQKKRVAIASALITPCELLILDEPTNHLDNSMINWLEKRLQQFTGAILMVTHDRYFLDRVTNRIIEIDRGSLYSYDANYSQFLEQKAIREQNDIGSERKRQSILRTELQWMQRGARARGTKSKSRIESYNALAEQESKAQNSALDLKSLSSRLGKKTMELCSVCKSFDGRCMVSSFDYLMARDARIGIVGANGSGKSTLLNIISGTLLPDSGEVIVGETVNLGYFSQECEQMDLDMRVIDYIKEVGENIKTADGVLTASQLLEQFLFPDNLQWNTISRLSGGERRRLYLMRILMTAPNILLLDEPTNDLDIQTLGVLEDYLTHFNGAVIAVSHDRFFLDRVANRIFELGENGVITEYIGGYTDYLETTAEQKPAKQIKQAKATPKQSRESKKKFTFKEQIEFDTIDQDVQFIEQELECIMREIEQSTSQYEKLQQLLLQKSDCQEKLEQKMSRWLYLNELADNLS